MNIGTHIDLRKDKSKPLEIYEPRLYLPGTHVDIWRLRRQRFAERFSVFNITNNLLANA